MTLTISSLVYALIVCFLFHIVGKWNRKYTLAVASLIYIFFINPLAGIYVLASSFVCFFAGVIIQRYRKEKRTRVASFICYISVAFFALSLLLLKYFPVYYPEQLRQENVLKYIVMPVGFSFYIFQAISYVIDVNRGKVSAAKNPVNIILYLAYFPKFVSGPIIRYPDFKAELAVIRRKTKFREPMRWKRALYYTLVGCFMKLVIADRLSDYISRLFEGYENYGSLLLLMGSLFYTIQIYCDFAGYSYVAKGISLMYGIEICENFKQPYCSSNITEFWRRWHMSLSRWFVDYLYIPLGGNRKGEARKIINTMIVFLVCGMWHGAGINFIVWGLLHGIFSAIDTIARDKGLNSLRSGAAGHIIAFAEASFAWIFFRASSFSSGVGYIRAMLGNGLQLGTISEQLERLELISPEPWIIVIMIVIMIVFDVIAYRKDRHLPELLAELPQGRRYLCFYFLFMIVVVFGIYGPDLGVKPIYMGF
ncbi:MAG: MBOAT family protein [Butyrivibrio sp.]|nr:MBOAT family protein [Butyrivibrio sp.]